MAWLRTTSDRVVITRAGFTFRFIANIPRKIPDVAVKACLAAGCLSASVAEFAPLTKEQKVTWSGKKDNAELDEAIRTVIESGNLDDFKVDKTPKSQVVNSLLTNKRTARDIADRFAEIMVSGDI